MWDSTMTLCSSALALRYHFMMAPSISTYFNQVRHALKSRLSPDALNPITTVPATMSVSNASINSYKIQQPHRNVSALEPLNINTLIFGKPIDKENLIGSRIKLSAAMSRIPPALHEISRGLLW